MTRATMVACAVLFAGAQTPRPEVPVDPGVYDGYVGRYQVTPTAVLTVSRDGDHLFTQLGLDPAVEIFPESAKTYFYRGADARITFEIDRQGRATAVARRGMGKDLRGKRLPDLPKEIVLAPAVFDGYIGQYRFTPVVTLTVSREGATFYGQLTGQPRIEMFASGAREFFMRIVEAQLTFDVDDRGRATAVVLHQNGQSPRATRIE